MPNPKTVPEPSGPWYCRTIDEYFDWCDRASGRDGYRRHLQEVNTAPRYNEIGRVLCSACADSWKNERGDGTVYHAIWDWMHVREALAYCVGYENGARARRADVAPFRRLRFPAAPAPQGAETGGAR